MNKNTIFISVLFFNASYSSYIPLIPPVHSMVVYGAPIMHPAPSASSPVYAVPYMGSGAVQPYYVQGNNPFLIPNPVVMQSVPGVPPVYAVPCMGSGAVQPYYVANQNASSCPISHNEACSLQSIAPSTASSSSAVGSVSQSASCPLPASNDTTKNVSVVGQLARLKKKETKQKPMYSCRNENCSNVFKFKHQRTEHEAIHNKKRIRIPCGFCPCSYFHKTHRAHHWKKRCPGLEEYIERYDFERGGNVFRNKVSELANGGNTPEDNLELLTSFIAENRSNFVLTR